MKNKRCKFKIIVHYSPKFLEEEVNNFMKDHKNCVINIGNIIQQNNGNICVPILYNEEDNDGV